MFFFNNNADDIRYFNYGYSYGADNWLIQGNTFYKGTVNNGIDGKDPTSWGFILLLELNGLVANNWTIRNNIFRFNDQPTANGLLAVQNVNGMDDWTIENNVFYSTSGTWAYSEGTYGSMTKHTFAEFENLDSVSGNNNVYTNPNLVATDTSWGYDEDYKFKLKIDETSIIALDAGSTTNPLYDDITGFVRDTVPDIGAYEFGTEGATTNITTKTITTTPKPAPSIPTLISAVLAADGITLSMTFSEAVQFGARGNGGVTIEGTTSGVVATTYTSGPGSTVLVYTAASHMAKGETIALNYVQPRNGIESSATFRDLASITDRVVTNNTDVATTTTTTITIPHQ